MPEGGVSTFERRRILSASALSAAAFNRAISSASTASASSSGISGIVSRDEILGLRERKLVGVEGIDEPDEAGMAGKGSLNLAGSITGEECDEVGLLLAGLLVTLTKLVWSGAVYGRLAPREKVLCIGGGSAEEMGISEGVGNGFCESSSSACSEMVSEMFSEPDPIGRPSSRPRSGLCLRIARSIGLSGLGMCGGSS